MMVPVASPACGAVRRQRGFSLVAAIFLIVVLAALGAFAVRVAMGQYQSANLALLEARAQAAAAAGIEYGANRTLRGIGGCAAINPATLTLNASGLTRYTVRVACASTGGHKVNGTPYTVYVLTSTATYSAYGRPDYVIRKVTRSVTNAPP